MSKKPADYFNFIANAKMNERPVDRGALNSLDIIDTKAGGLAGLIGGFSAAAMVALQLGQPWKNGPNVDVGLLAIALAALAFAGLRCAAAIAIISHLDTKLIEDGEALAVGDDGVLAELYVSRVKAYRSAHWFFVAGAIIMVLGSLAMLLELSLESSLTSTGSPPTSLPTAFDAGWRGQKVCERLFENDAVRAARCTFPPGVGHERHSHPPHWGYIVAGGTMRITTAAGTADRELKAGTSWWSDGIEWHEAVNIGTETSVYIIVEPKAAR